MPKNRDQLLQRRHERMEETGGYHPDRRGFQLSGRQHSKSLIYDELVAEENHRIRREMKAKARDKRRRREQERRELAEIARTLPEAGIF